MTLIFVKTSVFSDAFEMGKTLFRRKKGCSPYPFPKTADYIHECSGSTHKRTCFAALSDWSEEKRFSEALQVLFYCIHKLTE